MQTDNCHRTTELYPDAVRAFPRERWLLIGRTTCWSVRVAHVSDAAEVARVSDAFRSKYERAWPGPTAAIVRD